jgi:hypothetical protein
MGCTTLTVASPTLCDKRHTTITIPANATAIPFARSTLRSKRTAKRREPLPSGSRRCRRCARLLRREIHCPSCPEALGLEVAA